MLGLPITYIELRLSTLHAIYDRVAHEGQIFALDGLTDHCNLHDDIFDLVLHGGRLSSQLIPKVLKPHILPVYIIADILECLLGLLG